jgi:ribA/ribD-fused uncharacterized protein
MGKCSKEDERMTVEIGFFIREEPYGFLSNFERTPIEINGVVYPTNEHFYQSQKANCKPVHDFILSAPHARIAMVFGRELEKNKYLERYMKLNWGYIKLRVMLSGLRKKFENPTLKRMLLETGESILKEVNDEDPFWGIGDGKGSSWLGKLLMVVREECRRGFECKDFGYVRCNGVAHDRCPDTMSDICMEVADYEMRFEP